MVLETNERTIFRGMLRVTCGSYHPGTNSNGKPLSLLCPKEQREEIALLKSSERPGATEVGWRGLSGRRRSPGLNLQPRAERE